MRQQSMTCSWDVVQVDIASRLSKRHYSTSALAKSLSDCTIDIDRTGIHQLPADKRQSKPKPLLFVSKPTVPQWTFLTYRLSQKMLAALNCTSRYVLIAARKKADRSPLLPTFRFGSGSRHSGGFVPGELHSPDTGPLQVLQQELTDPDSPQIILASPSDHIDGSVFLFSSRQARRCVIDCIFRYTDITPCSTRNLIHNDREEYMGGLQAGKKRYSHALFEEISRSRVHFADESTPKSSSDKRSLGWRSLDSMLFHRRSGSTAPPPRELRGTQSRPVVRAR